jgi:polyisoprenoid-binding protein YceI
MRRALTRAALLVALPAASLAQPSDQPIAPPAAELTISLSALGLLPLDARFTRFTGILHLDPADPAACTVSLTAEVASLEMSSQSVRDDMLSPDLLDAARFPTLTYRGTCQNDAIDGVLTLHGVSRPLRLPLRRGPAGWDISGAFRRDEWGITGRPLLAGMTVRLHLKWRSGHG